MCAHLWFFITLTSHMYGMIDDVSYIYINTNAYYIQ